MCKVLFGTLLLLMVLMAQKVEGEEAGDSVEGDWLEDGSWWREGRFAFPR